MYFYGLNVGPPGAGHPGPRVPYMNKLGKGRLGNAIDPISSIQVK